MYKKKKIGKITTTTTTTTTFNGKCRNSIISSCFSKKHVGVYVWVCVDIYNNMKTTWTQTQSTKPGARVAVVQNGIHLHGMAGVESCASGWYPSLGKQSIFMQLYVSTPNLLCAIFVHGFNIVFQHCDRCCQHIVVALCGEWLTLLSMWFMSLFHYYCIVSRMAQAQLNGFHLFICTVSWFHTYISLFSHRDIQLFPCSESEGLH